MKSVELVHCSCVNLYFYELVPYMQGDKSFNPVLCLGTDNVHRYKVLNTIHIENVISGTVVWLL